jgi:hypothetical protein
VEKERVEDQEMIWGQVGLYPEESEVIPRTVPPG